MSTVELLSGSPAARWRHCLVRSHHAARVIWLQQGRPRRPWEGLRQLAFQARNVLGEEPVRDVLGRHQAAAALLLATSSPTPPGSVSNRPDLPARLESHLTHNTLVKRPFIDEGLDLLQAFLDSQDVLLLAPDLAELDSETVWLFDKLLQRRPEVFPSAVLGFEPDPARTEPDDRGIVWGPFQTDLSSFVFNASRLPGAQRLDLEEAEASADVSAEELDALRDRLGPDDDSLLLQAFEPGSGCPDRDVRQAMVELVRRTFAAHAFEAALLWGLRLLERCPEPGDLDALDAADLYNLTALAAHNRQFRTTGNERLVPFLETSWRRARELETRPALRSAICYRLAVTLGRRQDRLDPALERADEAVQVARSEPSKVPSAYAEAWARNVRALLWMRLGRMDKAVEDTERAFEMVDGLQNRLPTGAADADRWERDLVVSGSVLVNNRIALARLEDDPQVVERWEQHRGRITDDHPEFELYETAGWLQSYRRALRFDLALDRAERGLELARKERNTLWEYVFLAHAADLAYRLGRLERCLRTCEAARTFRREFNTPGLLEPLDLLYAEVLDRAGREDDARGVVRQVLTEGDLSPDRRIQAHALAARLAAKQGDAQGAEDSANAAIDAAVDSGHRDSLLLAAVAAGTASRLLGRFEEARTAYAQALALAGTGEPEDPPPPAGDVLEAHLGSWQLDPDDPAPVIRALRMLPEALKEPRGWALLTPLATAVEEVRRHRSSQLEDPDVARSLEQLHLAHGQIR